MTLSKAERRGELSDKEQWRRRQAWCVKCERAGLPRSGFWTSLSPTEPLRWYCWRCRKLTETRQVP
jgi:hypothetical protein